MYIRRITTGAAAATLALLATACSDQLTAPAAHPSELALTTSSAWSPTLISNSVRYSDTGGKPATGRSGSATLQALALLGQDGATSLELRAGRADGAEGGVAELAHVQVKALAGMGTEKFTTNHHEGLDAPLPLAGLSRGDALQVQATVRGIDAHRTDVVAVTESVKLRPDLEVTLSALGTVSPGAPVNITAVVAEKNGDLGATTSCRLAVDGVVVDQAQGIWVDAHDAVSCAFTHRFPQPGSYTVTVSTGATAPGDWDESNNADSAPVQVAAADVALPHFAMVEHKVGYRHSFATYRQFDQGQPSSELVADDTAHEDLQMVQMNGSVFGLVIPGPVTVEVSQATGGQTVHSARMTAESMHGMWCASTGQGPTMFFSCSQAFGTFRFTHFNYQRYAGTVTYHSVVYSRTWFEGVMQENVYHSNGGSSNFPPLALGDRFQMSVRIIAADGTTYNADADLPLTEQIQEGSTPESCTSEDWGGGRLYETCNRTSFRYRVVSGRNR